MSAKNTKTGQSLSALRLNAKLRESALRTLLLSMNNHNKRLTPEDIHARLIFLIGAVLALTFFVITGGAVYALVFVTQPVGAQAPNDRDFIQLLQTLAIASKRLFQCAALLIRLTLCKKPFNNDGVLGRGH
jgi:hypothetical protein